MMTRNRRVGTLTLGISLIGMGSLFAVHLFVPDAIPYHLIFRLWPAILILLGIEVVVSYAVNKEEKIKYDGWAVFIMIVMMIFAGALAGCQLLLETGLVKWNIGF